MQELFDKVINVLSIEEIVQRLSEQEKYDIISKLENLDNVYPFSHYEYVISNILGLQKMTLEDYENMRIEYLARNEYLHTFQMAGKSVGVWAETLIRSGGHGLHKPSKKTDPNYSQQTSYDAYMDRNGENIRVEIKASRVTESGNDQDIFIDKALFSDTNKPFWMNFQQLKPQYCDVFIFIAIFRDKLHHRILSSDDVRYYGESDGHSGKFTDGQHSGNKGHEGQLHIKDNNIRDFDVVLVDAEHIRDGVINAFQRQKSGNTIRH